MTRKRTRPSLEQPLCETCTNCHGTNCIKTAETVSYDIFREIIMVSKIYKAKEFLVLVAQVVIDFICNEKTDYFAELKNFVDKKLDYRQKIHIPQDQYDVVLV